MGWDTKKGGIEEEWGGVIPLSELWLNILVLSEKITLDTQFIGKEKGVDSRL